MRLDDAVHALRDETCAASEGADETRSRVLADLRRSRSRRSKRALVILPIAAVLAGATASAGVSGRLPMAWHAALRVLHLAPAPTAVEPAHPLAPPDTENLVPPPEPTSAQEPSAPRMQVVAAPPATPKLRSAAMATVTATPTPTPTATATPTATPTDSLALFRNAHRLHFTAQDPAAALAAWDAYLREDPAGSLALEARYNRALCLVRLGRSHEAREALAPFADGRNGGYRKAEARALLDMIDRPSSSE
jgi:hypothetical protein